MKMQERSGYSKLGCIALFRRSRSPPRSGIHGIHGLLMSQARRFAHFFGVITRFEYGRSKDDSLSVNSALGHDFAHRLGVEKGLAEG